MSDPRKFLIMVEGRPEGCGDAGQIKWKELPADISRVMKVLNSGARRVWNYGYRSKSHVYDEDGKIGRLKTPDEILDEDLTAFGQSLCNAGISREVFDRACSDLKEYEGHVFTVSKSNYREVIKYNPDPMVGYPPNPHWSKPSWTRYTGHKKGLAERQFHLNADVDLANYADHIFGAVDAQELATKRQQNDNYLHNIEKGVVFLKNTYTNLMANINMVAAEAAVSYAGGAYADFVEMDYLDMYEQSTPAGSINRKIITLHLRWVIEAHIHNSLRYNNINSPTIQNILALRFNHVPYHENIGYDEKSRLEERCKESMVFGLPMWSMKENSREPCPRNDFEASADAVTNEEVQAERDDALDEWAQNQISVCRFPHPEVMSPSTKKAQEAILTAYKEEANKYTTILRAIFVCYADLIEDHHTQYAGGDIVLHSWE